MSLLLLFNNSTWGALLWSGPAANRTVVVEPESRRAVIV